MCIEDISRRVLGIHETAAKYLPTSVRCDVCGSGQAVEPAECLRSGWPECCSQTMSFVANGSWAGV